MDGVKIREIAPADMDDINKWKLYSTPDARG